WFNQLEREYSRCEQEIQDFNKDIERLENASEEKMAELRSKISSLKSQLYQVKKDVMMISQNQGVNSTDNANDPPIGREVAIGTRQFVKLRVVEGPWSEDWRVARGHLTN
ncbi:15555_t:CDS:2, partial [Funneliformis geosporum]